MAEKETLLLRLSENLYEKHFPLLDLSKTNKIRSAQVTLLPGEEVGIHSTGQNEEILFVISGEGSVEAEGFKKTAFNRSNYIYIPPETEHNVCNTGEEPLIYIYNVVKVN